MFLRVGSAGLTILSLWALPAWATAVNFNTGSPDGVYGAASRPNPEVEAADDFTLAVASSLTNATFIGLLPFGANVSTITEVDVGFIGCFRWIRTRYAR